LVNKRRIGIRFKFIALIVALMLTVFAIVTVALVTKETTSLKADLLAQTKAFASLASSPIGDAFVLYKDSGVIRIKQEVQRFTDLDPSITNVAVVDTKGQLLFSQNTGYSVGDIAAQAAGYDPSYTYDSQGRVSQIIYPYLEDFGLRRYSIIYQVSSASIDASTRTTALYITLLGIGGMLLAALLVYLFVNQLLIQPLKTVSSSAIVISNGDFEKEISGKRDDEIGDLARSINNMADALKDDIQKLQEADKLKSEFMVIASHNLRTPVAIIDGVADSLQHLKHDPSVDPYISSLVGGVARLKTFANDMLSVSQIEAGGLENTLTAGDLKPLVDDIDQSFRKTAAAKNITFITEVADGLPKVDFNTSYIRSAIWNLLDNALKFSQAKGEIRLSLTQESNAVVITVSDQGAGISPEELPKLFTKFHRGTDLMEYNYEGMGLGLYLVKLVADLHHGKVKATSEVGKGTTVRVELPVAAAAAVPVAA